MKKIQIYDPALCCSSGVCGVEVDQALVDFAADVAWAEAQGAVIERFNMAKEPLAFAGQPAVKQSLDTAGEKALPLTVLAGEVRLSGRYPTRAQLGKWLGIAATAATACAEAAQSGAATPQTQAASTSACCAGNSDTKSSGSCCG